MRVELAPITYWRHDLSHCLHTTAGVLLGFHGLDPVEVLGAAWGFYYPGDVRREEYYFPGAAESLLGGLAPYHAIRSRWHTPADADEGWRQVRAMVAGGAPVAVAADNFHLPFRPAYRDVHTNHLLAVYGFDDRTGEVLVADPVPPAFQGPIPLAAFTAARDSQNPVRHSRDLFFTANPIGNRWLELDVGAEQPAFTADFVRYVLGENLRGFTAPSDDTYRGRSGLSRFLDDVITRIADDPAAVDEAFVVLGPVLAVTGLHAEYLALAGRRFDDRRLYELGRLVDAVAHDWAALRIAVATCGTAGAAGRKSARHRAASLLAAHDRALSAMADAAR
ncbi:BtrH N-terminal domain-containing protein [Actinoplanes sp. NEAU-A12]|uniref:BtrH N-terminal domain-containing protein n=1 Tax=Actinoplanes sandaracinus TaxID=3045177 RepID=A0ABT6WTL6_9ACTN|nr:BtrH N-terminal domain-containing protein [Actinoplanes sandaracinus]MDI6102996.1 BtrH N-terminal domain-containing protein [Actinoplanes sandaracinus]